VGACKLQRMTSGKKRGNKFWGYGGKNCGRKGTYDRESEGCGAYRGGEWIQLYKSKKNGGGEKISFKSTCT